MKIAKEIFRRVYLRITLLVTPLRPNSFKVRISKFYLFHYTYCRFVGLFVRYCVFFSPKCLNIPFFSPLNVVVGGNGGFEDIKCAVSHT